MDQSTVSDLRREASRLYDLAASVLDAADGLHRRLSAIEDSQAAYQESVRRLRAGLKDVS